MAYLFFAEGDGLDAQGDALLVPAENFLGLDPASDATCLIHFKAVNGTATDSTVLVTYATTANGGGFKRFADKFGKLLTQLAGKRSKEMVVVADEDNSIYFDSIISGVVTITSAA